jgi:heterodisulfide reductase subunit B
VTEPPCLCIPVHLHRGLQEWWAYQRGHRQSQQLGWAAGQESSRRAWQEGLRLYVGAKYGCNVLRVRSFIPFDVCNDQFRPSAMRQVCHRKDVELGSTAMCAGRHELCPRWFSLTSSVLRCFGLAS